ncbi:glycosyltransferase family 2 protein [Pseudoclavibacter sp. CFCC 13611]|uniref:glycosyltransferase family 2 protein n=1 Tax=Pseudoclavibacter sp. CFCC 13611 TaxID=2615178 RepID=UPI001787CCDD|nr:glycosyltransferase [Pseudoclavibacter sp. CFCC 13611]
MLSPPTRVFDVVVVDDHSTNDMQARPDEYAAAHGHVHIIHAEQNRGHRPAGLRAYRVGLDLDPDYIVFVDGDGQFVGDDVAQALKLAEAVDCDVVHGVRTGRTDLWYRETLTKTLAAWPRWQQVRTCLR